MKKASTLIILSILFCGLIQAQEKTTLSVKDLNSDIEKYVKKNYKDYKILEAYHYSLVYVMTVTKGDVTEKLIFDRDGKFVNKATEADKAKVALQTRTTLSLKEVKSDITKYIKKNFEGYKHTEAFMYEEVYSTKIAKGPDTETLIFDKDGKFLKKMAPAAASVPAAKSDSVPVKKEEPKTADTAKKK